MEDTIAQKVIKRYEDLKAQRINWDSHWDQVAKYVIPRKDNVYGQATIGEKRNNLLFDSEAITAADELAAALHGMLTNPSTIWFGLTTGDRDLDRKPAVQKWLYKSTVKMIGVLNNSNFQTEILEDYTDLATIGTSCLRMEEDEETVVRFYSQPVYNVMIDENSKGDIDVVSREFEFDFRQLMQEYGEAIDEDMQRDLGSEPSKKFKIIQEVSPRTAAEAKGEVGSKAMPWKSVHILKDKGFVLRESGFEEFPYAVARWTKTNKEKYGRSPAMKALPDIKMINMMKKVTIQGAQLVIAPPLQIPSNAFVAPLKLSPFGTNYKRPNMRDKVEPLFTGGRPEIGLDIIEYVQRTIRKAFFLDKLNIDLGDRATTMEVMQKRDEQLRALGPILGRMDREKLRPIIDRTFGVMERREMFEEMPEEMEGIEKLDIKYMSTIAQAQLVTQSDNIVRALNASSFVLQTDPTVMDNIDGDKLLRYNLEIFGVDPVVLRDEKEIKALREQRAKAQQEAQEMAMAKEGSEAAKNMSQAEQE